MQRKHLITGLIILLLCLGLPTAALAFQPFPDTGQTQCYSDTVEISCPSPGEAFYGQDAQYQPRLPRSYTKLEANGVELAAHARSVGAGFID